MNLRSMLITGAAVGAAAIGGGAIASAASSTSTTTTGSSSTPPSGMHGAPANMPRPGSASHENAEKPVTGTAADKAKAAAIKSVGGGTAGAVTTDFTGNGYEVTVTKTDGSKVEVHLDKSFNVQQGHCAPGSRGGPGGPGGYGPPSGQSAPNGSGTSYGSGAPSAITG